MPWGRSSQVDDVTLMTSFGRAGGLTVHAVSRWYGVCNVDGWVTCEYVCERANVSVFRVVGCVNAVGDW